MSKFIPHGDISGTIIEATELSVSGSLQMGSGSRVSGSLIPLVTDDPGHSLGHPDIPWKDAFLSSGSLYIDNIKTLHREGGVLKLGTGEDFEVSGSITGSRGHFRGDVILIGDPGTAMDLRVVGDGGKSRLHVIAFGGSGSNAFPLLRLERAAGSRVSPSDITAGTRLGIIEYAGRRGGTSKLLSCIEVVAGGTFGPGNTPTALVVHGIRTGSTTLERQWVIDENASLLPWADRFNIGKPARRVGQIYAETGSFQDLRAPSTIFYGFGPTTDLDISTGGWVDIPIDKVRRADAPFSHSLGTPVIELTRNCKITVVVSIGTDVSSGTNRSKSAVRLVADVGSGFQAAPDSIRGMYNRSAAQGANNASVTLYGEFNAGDKIKVQAIRGSGTNTVIVSADSMALHLRREG